MQPLFLPVGMSEWAKEVFCDFKDFFNQTPNEVPSVQFSSQEILSSGKIWNLYVLDNPYFIVKEIFGVRLLMQV